MPDLDIATFFENLLGGLLGHSDAHISQIALQDAAVDAGYDPQDMQGLDWQQIYQNACEYPGVPADYRANAQGYEGSGSVEHVVRQIQQVTEVHNVTQQFTDNSIDNSTNFDVGGDFNVDGDFDFTNNPVTATGGGVAAGHDVNGAATGDGSNATGSGDINDASGGGNVIDGDNFGQVNSGDNAAQVNQGTTLVDQSQPGFIVDPVRGEFPPGTILSDRLVESPVLQHPLSPVTINTGAGDQQVANVEGQGNITDFGGGDITNVQGSSLAGSAVGTDHVGAFDGNTVDHGSNLGIADGGMESTYEDSSEHIDIHPENSIVEGPIDTEQGPGDQATEHHDLPPLPV